MVKKTNQEMKNKIKTGSDFSGVGAFDQALLRLGIDYETIFACDMDKYARQTYIHNYGEPQYYPENVYDREIPKESLDIYMTSPPCQAFSLAGKRMGKEDKRGILFFNSLEFIQENKPKYFIFENVKGLLSHDKIDKTALYGRTFQEWINHLGGKSINGNATIFPYENSVPYHIYFQVLNAKHYGIPQNRERIFIIGIRDDKDNDFQFPKPFLLEKTLKDVLEIEVNEKYFLSDKMIKGFIRHSEIHKEKGTGFQWNPKDENDIANCLNARGSALGVTDNTIKIGFVNQDTQASQIFLENGTSPNICSGTHGYALGYVETIIGTWRTHEDGKGFRATEDNNCPTIPARAREDGSGQPVIKIGAIRGRNPENPKSRQSGLETEQMLEINENEISNTLTTVQKDNVLVYDLPKQKKIRRLTPRECFRLMDFPETFDFSVVSNSQAYKQAGNSIVVNVLCEIIKKLKLN